MAKVTRSLLGTTTGKLGDIYFRGRNGNIFIVSSPDSFIPGKDPESTNRRYHFGVSSKTASKINSDEELKGYWKQKFKKNYNYNFIVGKIKNQISGKTSLSDICILPSNTETGIRVGFSETGNNSLLKIQNLPTETEVKSIFALYFDHSGKLSSETKFEVNIFKIDEYQVNGHYILLTGIEKYGLNPDQISGENFSLHFVLKKLNNKNIFTRAVLS